MNPKIFLSHTFADKPFVHRLARDLENQGIGYWLDDAEIKVGESLIQKIRDGIDGVEYVAVILSPESVVSAWVQREVVVAMNLEITGRKLTVLPVMYKQCDLPGFLLGKLYADFTDEKKYEDALERVVRSVGVVFNRAALRLAVKGATLGAAIDASWAMGLPILRHPFHRPFQYMGMSVGAAATAVGGTPNGVGNILLDTEECRLFLEAEGNYIAYVEVDIKRTAPHNQDEEFDSEPLLGALSINPTELELVRKQTHYHTYYDHRKKLKIGVCCFYDGAPLTVSFSSKYYGM